MQPETARRCNKCGLLVTPKKDKQNREICTYICPNCDETLQIQREHLIFECWTCQKKLRDSDTMKTVLNGVKLVMCIYCGNTVGKWQHIWGDKK